MVEGVSNIVYICNRRPIVFKKLIMFLRTIFENSSFMLFALQNYFLVWLSFVHSIKIYLIEYWFPHGHFGGGSSLRMKEWASWVCPIRSRVRVVSSLLVLLGSSFFSFKMGCIWKSLLWGFSSHNCCHFLVTICLILGLRSVYGVLMFLSGVMLTAALANESALFWIPIWLGIQQNIRSWQLADFPIWCFWVIEELRWVRYIGYFKPGSETSQREGNP